MRQLAALTLVLAVQTLPLFATAATFPAVPSPERPVSDPVFGPAALAQTSPHIATNGQLSLTAWIDNRDGAPAVFATRIDAAGSVLDPAGLRLAGTLLDAVLWNGSAFVVVMGQRLVFITPSLSMNVVDLGEPGYVFAGASNGADVRLLYINVTGANALGIVVGGGDGHIVARKTLWTDAPGQHTGTWVGGGGESGFLVLRNVVDGAPAATHVVATRVTPSGDAVSRESNLTFAVADGDLLTGSESGFLFARSAPSIFGLLFDDAGVLAPGFSNTPIASPYGLPGMVAITRDGDGYLAAWQGSAAGFCIESVGQSSPHDPDHPFVYREIGNWKGAVGGIAVAANGSMRVVVDSQSRNTATGLDLFVRRITLGDEVTISEAQVATASAAVQAHSSVAGGANGYAVAWGEIGPDTYAHVVVRRFADDGTPQDAPIQAYFGAATGSPPQPSIVSNGEVYLVGWPTPAGILVRRLSARTGLWIDPDPIPIGMSGNLALASNGIDALAVAYPAGDGPTLAARRIALLGAPLASPAVNLAGAANGTAITGLAVASNGSDYLVSWLLGPFCAMPCSPLSRSILALRVAAGGTPIDAVPLVLDFQLGHLQLSVDAAAAAGRYLVTWSTPDGPRGTRITAQGEVLDHDADSGGVLLDDTRSSDARAVPVNLAGRFALAIRRKDDRGTSILSGVDFDAATDLKSVAALPRIELLTYVNDPEEGVNVPSFGLAAHGLAVGLSYNHLSTEAGNVPRTFFRFFSQPPTPRRRVTR